MTANFWQDRRVFVTGHTGFMGGWLCEKLLSRGARVTGYALPAPTEPSLFEAIRLWERVPTVTADVRDGERLAALVAASRPEVVFHLAAQPLVRTAHADPVGTYSTNLMGTVNMLDAIRRTSGIGAAIIVTTDKVYDNREWAWGYRETDTLGGHEPYGASKACCELVVDSYLRSYFGDPRNRPGIATIRAGNVIGGGDWAADRLIPDAMRAFAANRVLDIRSPDSVRPWQHVLEPVSGMMALAERLTADPAEWSGPWNLGPEDGDSRSVAWMADRLARAWPGAPGWRAVANAGPREARLLTLSSAKARDRLGWSCRWSAESAIHHTAKWYRAYYRGEDVTTLTGVQINRHQKGDESGKEQRSETAVRRRAVA